MITWSHKNEGIMEIRNVFPGKFFFLDISTGSFASARRRPKTVWTRKTSLVPQHSRRSMLFCN